MEPMSNLLSTLSLTTSNKDTALCFNTLPLHQPASPPQAEGEDPTPASASSPSSSLANHPLQSSPTQRQFKRPFHDITPDHAVGDLCQPRQKQRRMNLSYGCPYRKCDPWTFNIRDHQTCATKVFLDIAEVKRHIMKAHKLRDPPVKCNKCDAHFGNNTALELHAKNNLCSLKPHAVGSVYTPGITELMEFKLRDRRVKSQVRTWEALWATIFPDHPSIPPPDFEPVAEGAEARRSLIQDLLQLHRAGQGPKLCELLQEESDPEEAWGRIRKLINGPLAILAEAS